MDTLTGILSRLPIADSQSGPSVESQPRFRPPGANFKIRNPRGAPSNGRDPTRHLPGSHSPCIEPVSGWPRVIPAWPSAESLSAVAQGQESHFPFFGGGTRKARRARSQHAEKAVLGGRSRHGPRKWGFDTGSNPRRETKTCGALLFGLRWRAWEVRLRRPNVCLRPNGQMSTYFIVKVRLMVTTIGTGLLRTVAGTKRHLRAAFRAS